MGTERSLAHDHRVSRATLREALHILQIRGAVRVQRGNGGGIRVTVPELAAVANALKHYLQVQAAAPNEFWEAEAILAATARDAGQGATRVVLVHLAQLIKWSRPNAPLSRDILRKRDEPCRARALAAILIDDAGEKRRIGSEWEICGKFAVDRRIVRQAVRILQESGLAAPRRGRGHGIELVKPPPGTMLRATYSFFAARKLKAEPCNRAIEYLNVAIARLAAMRCTPADRATLHDVAMRVESGDDDSAMMEIMESIFAAARSKVLEAALRCLLAYVARAFPDICRVPDPLAGDFRFAYAATARAVASGEEARAVDAQLHFHAALHRVAAYSSESPVLQI